IRFSPTTNRFVSNCRLKVVAPPPASLTINVPLIYASPSSSKPMVALADPGLVGRTNTFRNQARPGASELRMLRNQMLWFCGDLNAYSHPAESESSNPREVFHPDAGVVLVTRQVASETILVM